MAYNTRKPPIDAALVRLTELARENLPQGTRFRLKIPAGQGDLDFWALRGFCQELAAQAADWQCFHLAVGPVCELTVLDITAAQLIEAGKAEAAQSKNKAKQTALAALSLLNPRQKPCPKAGPHQSRKGPTATSKRKVASKEKVSKVEAEELWEQSDSSGSVAFPDVDVDVAPVFSSGDESGPEASSSSAGPGRPAGLHLW